MLQYKLSAASNMESEAKDTWNIINGSNNLK